MTRRTPNRPEDWFDAETLAEAKRYAKPLHRIKLAASAVESVLAVGFLLLKGGPWAARLLGGPWPLRVVVGVLAMNVIATVVAVGPTAYIQLSYDKRWGLSNQTPGRFAGDQVKDVLVSTVIGSVLLIPVYAVIRATTLWWLYGWLAFLAVQLLIAFVYPVVIMPRFNKFTPLEDGELRRRIEAVADSAGTTIQGVYTMDASQRTARGNAFVAGFGTTKRVVLFDTILEHPLETIEQIVAHEIGHYRRHHVLLSFPFQAVLYLGVFALLHAVANWSWALDRAGVHTFGDPGSVPLFIITLGAAIFATKALTAWMTRFLEREADLEALELLRDPAAFIDVWRRLAPKDKAELEPSWWKRLSHSHPGIAERMAFGQQWAEANGVPR